MSTVLRPFPVPADELEPEQYSSGVSFQEYVAILKRRRSLILQAFLLITIVGVLVTFLTKPVYQAVGEMLIDPPSMTVSQVNTESPLSGLFGIGAQQSTATVAEVLQTLPLQQQVFQKDGQVEFGIVPGADTSVINVAAEATDPHTAALAVNDLMGNYIQQSSDQSVADLESARQFAQQQSTAAHKSLVRSEEALRAFQERYHITELGQDRSNQIALVSGLSRDYAGQQAAMDALQARLAADQTLIGQQPANQSHTLLSTNPTIEGLQASLRSLKVQKQAVTQKGGFNPNGKAPAILSLNAQIAELQHQLDLQPKLKPNVVSNPNGVRETLRAAIVDLNAGIRSQTATMADTKSQLAQARADLGRYPDRQLALDRLQRARDGAARSATTFDGQLADLSLREKARHASAHVIQPAAVPLNPIRPKKALNILFACLIGLFVGICLALLQEFLDDRINTLEDADRLLGLPSLGRVPALTGDGARLLPQMTGANPGSESYRILRTNIHFASIDNPLKTLLVASSSPGEGKTTTAVNLAFAMAMDGKKVILMDSDLRRPTIHKMLGLPAMPGLTDVLAGTAKLDDVLMQHSDMPNLMALGAGTLPPNPSELLGSRAFRTLMETLTTRSDLVVLDSPPVLAAADAQILASQVDGVIMVVETGETRKVAARQTLALLRHARANVLGVAYNKLSGRPGDAYHYNYAAPALPDGKGKNGRGGRRLSAPNAARTQTPPQDQSTEGTLL